GALIDMGTMIESAISGAITALENRDIQKAKDIIAYDEEIDAQERLIEEMCMKLLLRQQPVASDLRMISTALKLITDMERIGDHAADISELAIMLRDLPQMNSNSLREMAVQTSTMLIRSVEAYVEQDEEKARAVIRQDDVVDDLFVTVKSEMIEAIRQNSDFSEAAADLLMAAKYFERIGDHATNIAEWTVYAFTGRHED
ncbi:MAG: phosphate signaling complex protein PhoU, partial [Oscillospiraceae bacterium]|nr:phosphate signaling complex protein PhoU [Oscillospiraceae bacterium]